MTLTGASGAIVPRNVITDFALGKLSPAKHIIVSCQSEIVDSLSSEVAFQEDIAAAMIAYTEPRKLSPSFINEVIRSLPRRYDPSDSDNDNNIEDLAPMSLRRMIGQGIERLKWRLIIPGLAIHYILGQHKANGDDQLYLLKAKSDTTIPEYSHDGEVWMLILEGNCHVGGQSFKRGDIYIKDKTEPHCLRIEVKKECVCLLMTQGPMRSKGLLPNFIKPIIGVS